MPRGAKESDEEVEVKTAGRRSRLANTTADSPLRRSTRNRQQKNEDVSPDSSNNAAGPRTRTTRRTTAATTSQETEGTRSLRSRRTSTTSETSENHDTDDSAKRPPVKKSIVVVGSAPDTPSKARRSMRAGSESKIIQSPARTTRRTRANSADVEERDIEIKHHDLQKVHQNTPTKTRRRVSALPLQPSVVEESEKEKIQNDSINESNHINIEEVDDNTQNDAESNEEPKIITTNVDTPNKSMNLTQSPSLRLNLSCTEPESSYTVTSDNTDNSATKESNETSTIITDAIKASSGAQLKSIIEDINDTHMDEDTQVFNTSNIINEITMSNSPKVIVERIKSPAPKNMSEQLEKSPGNKENEKANVLVNKIENKSSETPTQRKSLLSLASENISPNLKLTKSIDDRLLTSNIDSRKISSPMIRQNSESFVDTGDENSATDSPSLPNESVIFMAEIPKSSAAAIKPLKARTVDVLDSKQIPKGESMEVDQLKTINQTPKGLVADSLEASVMIIDEIKSSKVSMKTSENAKNDEVDKLLITDNPDASSMLVDEEATSNVSSRKSILAVDEEMDEEALLASPQASQMDVDEEIDVTSVLSKSPDKAVDEASILKTPEKSNSGGPILKSPEMDVDEASNLKSPDKPVEGASILKTPEKAIGEAMIVKSPEKAVGELSTLDSPEKAVKEALILQSPEKAIEEATIIKTPEKAVEATTVKSPEKAIEATTAKSPEKTVKEASILKPAEDAVEGAMVVESLEKATEELPIVESSEKAVEEETIVQSPEKAVVEASILESPEKAVEEATILKLIDKVSDDTSMVESPAKVAMLNTPQKSVQEQPNIIEATELEIQNTDKIDEAMPSIPAVETVNTLENDDVFVDEQENENPTGNPTDLLTASEEVSNDGKLLTEECQLSTKKVDDVIVDDDSKSLDDSDTDIVKCFKDIPAEEWNGEETSQSNENVDTAADTEKAQSNTTTEKCVEGKAGDMNVENTGNNLDACKKTAAVENPMNDGEPMDTADDELELDVDKIEDSPTKRLNYYESMFNRSNKESPKPLDKPDNVNLNDSNAQASKSPIKRITPIKVNILEDKRMNLIDTNFPRKSLDSALNIPKSLTQDVSKSRKSLGSSVLLNKNKDLNELDNLMKKKSLEKPRKSLNKSKQLDEDVMDICEDKDEEDKQENDEKNVALNSSKNKSRKSLNKSGLSAENIDEEKSKNSLQSTKENRKSLTKSSIKKFNFQSMSLIDKDESDDDDFRLYNKSIAKNLNKSKNVSTIVQVNSDSEPDDELESTERSPMLPAFLYGGNTSSSNSDSDNESSSIDDDVKREYNLDGTDVSEYSDDNVVGDICRESETETSGSEADEEDDDMADFIVDDDEDVDEEASEEDDEDEEEEQGFEIIEEGDENDEVEVDIIDDEDNEIEMDVNDDEEDSEDADEDDEEDSEDADKDEEEIADDEEGEENEAKAEEDDLPPNVAEIRNIKKHLEFNSSAEGGDLDKSLKKSKTPLTKAESRLIRINKFRQSWNEQCETSIDAKIDSVDVVESERSPKKLKTSRASLGELNKSITGKESSASASKQSAKRNKSLSKSMLENLFVVEDTVESVKASQSFNDTSCLSKGSLSRKSMIVSTTTSPETISLLKEKLNDTLPALKLDSRGKGKRKSTLFRVKNAIAEDDQQSQESNDNNLVEEEAISKNAVCESSGEKKKKKKNKKVKLTNGFAVENTSHELGQESPEVSLNSEEKISAKEEKRKKKKQTQKESEEVSDGVTQKKKKMKQKAGQMLEVEVEESQKKKKKVQLNYMIEDDTEVSGKKAKNLPKTKTPFNLAKNKKKRRRSVDLDDTTFTLEDPDISINSVSVESKKKRKSREDQSLQTKAGKSSASVQVPLTKSNNVKRLPDDVLESLSDVKLPPKKKRKIDPRLLPSKTMLDDDTNSISNNLRIEDDGFIPLSYSGGTTQFYVENLEKPKKSKKLAAVYSFRERMLRRNPRQPVSAYLMYQQKRKASNKDKY